VGQPSDLFAVIGEEANLDEQQNCQWRQDHGAIDKHDEGPVDEFILVRHGMPVGKKDGIQQIFIFFPNDRPGLGS